MRRLIVIILLSCLVLNTGGYLFLVKHQQNLLKKEMMNRLRNGHDTQFQEELEFALINGKPADPSFRWEEEKEFHYKGKMYDVISKQTIDGKLKIRCIEDTKEETLLKQLADLQERESSKPEKSKAIMLLFTAFLIRTDFSTAPIATNESPLYFEHYLSFFNIVDKEVITPPPRAIKA